jgi:nitroimidazol reductase NimA-like FMN-containing flavoprotein (pyridoxamine 5'-phosphate oxidase superfamily)
MRRQKQQLSDARTREILRRGSSGVLALLGDEDYPYAVPLSYVYDEANGRLYFHSARQGHKVDAVRRHGKGSFCVIDRDQVVPEEYTTYFRSVIAFGRVRLVEDEEERWAAMELLARRYYPGDTEEHRTHAIGREYKPVQVIALDIAHLTGKEAIELVQKQE